MANQERDPMIDMYVHETFQLIEQLENIIIDSEKSNNMEDAINEIFRIMHTIKGNSMMMKYENIAELAHATEDMFDYLRTNHPENVDYSQITDIVLDSVDFIKDEVVKIQNEEENFGNADELRTEILGLLESLKFMGEAPKTDKRSEKTDELAAPAENNGNSDSETAQEIPKENYDNLFYVHFLFEDGCQMENVRAFGVVNNLDEFGCEIYHYPKDLENDQEELQIIKSQGMQLVLNCKQNETELKYFFDRVSFLKDLAINQITADEFINYANEFQKYKSEHEEEVLTEAPAQEEPKETAKEEVQSTETVKEAKAVKEAKPARGAKETRDVKEINRDINADQSHTKQQKYINVSVEKLDSLMNLVGELVVSESMVTQNPELKVLNIQSIEKAAGQMRKIINEVQDIVMEIRMVPLSMTFQRMNRIVRDMCAKTDKDVDLVIIGQETEVDKNIIEHISDPLMHLIRNAIDHGVETPKERKSKGKPTKGTVTLEAKNAGGDVWIIVRDDGKGLDRDKIINKASDKGLLKKPADEYSDREAYALIFEAGLSTKDEVTNFSGRGVGMDAVVKELERIGGTVIIESEKDKGTSMNLRIPLTLAIINGMVMNVGDSKFTLPITSIKESFKAKTSDIIVDPNHNEMILVRGDCYSIVRLHDRYNIKTDITKLEEGILVMLENDDHKICLFVDQLIGEHQVVVKSFSKYIKKIQGISGCAHLGDGGICLILDPSGFLN